MKTTVGLISISLILVAGDMSMLMRQQPESLPDFLLEEVILDSLVNLMSPLPEDRAFLPNLADPVTDREIGFFLYSRDNPAEPVALRIGDVAIFKTSNFNVDKPMKVLIHGWTDTGSSSWVQDVRKNYLKAGDYNVVVVDWSVASLKDYLTASRLSRQVGDHVSQFLEFLMMEGIVIPEDIHVLGHSLGAHIAGFIGSNLSGKIARITGMDPARPDFEYPFLREPNDRLDPTDAKFVDVIHTCAGTVGFVRPIGHVDFYPNGGIFRQPGCPVLMTQYCSHGRSHQFMSESIVNPTGFPAVECNDWKEFKGNRCGSNRIVYMGEKLDTEARGIYFLETNADAPFGRGEL
ncbi:pancreatic lipase-related protein 2 [Nasonia vitripennis]|uniref:phospholipase A1 n=1 Tax=Nasonia vitripennis TaxID=7425 RepID=A0A7M7GAX4_NASVI|nr:pancreatic lipase-related protein 2 [Nasonia vitripennis]